LGAALDEFDLNELLDHLLWERKIMVDEWFRNNW
jgi:hypothetical protein